MVCAASPAKVIFPPGYRFPTVQSREWHGCAFRNPLDARLERVCYLGSHLLKLSKHLGLSDLLRVSVVFPRSQGLECPEAGLLRIWVV